MLEQGRLAAACLGGDEDEPTPAGDGCFAGLFKHSPRVRSLEQGWGRLELR